MKGKKPKDKPQDKINREKEKNSKGKPNVAKMKKHMSKNKQKQTEKIMDENTN